MHARHRNGPGNGYWSNAMGMRGQTAASRISPEGSMRGHRMYNSDHRNNNRGGFGRGGHSKQFQPQQPPSRGIDIFKEAGRLAAEYLVSKGVLPPNALSGTWRNDGLKNQMGEFQGFRPHEVDNMPVPMDGRVSAHTRLGNASLDVGPVRRRYSDDNNSMGSRNSMRGRRRTGPFKNNGSEMNRELGKSGSWAERSRASPGIEADNDASAGHSDEQPVGKDGDGGMQTLSPGELAQEGDPAAHLESELEKHNLVKDAGAKASSSHGEKYLSSDAKEESPKESDDANKSATEADAVNEGKNDNDLERKQDMSEVTASAREDTLLSKDNVDLVKHCKFAQVPTKVRSSLTVKVSKGDQAPMNEDAKISERELSAGSVVHIIDVPDESSAGNASSHQIHKLNSLDSDVLKAPAVDKELEAPYMTRPEQCSRSRSFPERSLYKEPEELDEELSVFGRSSSMFIDRGGKRAADDDTDGRENFKKLREWTPMDTESDGCLPLSNSMENQPTSQVARTSQSTHAVLSPDQKSLNISLFPKSHDESCEITEEKQLFPGSFKTCDLNLIGTCDANENHDAGRVFVFPSIIETGKEAAPIDVDLSMSNNCSATNKNAKLGISNNDIEVIDLENDSAQEDKTFSHPEGRPDSVFTDLDGFPNNVHNANEIPDVQDGYGLMFSELLGNDSPNCSSVPTDLNSLHNDMGLPNGEGILADDDSIYMSLGEIPISFLSTWEQPTQDYGKPF